MCHRHGRSCLSPAYLLHARPVLGKNVGVHVNLHEVEPGSLSLLLVVGVHWLFCVLLAVRKLTMTMATVLMILRSQKKRERSGKKRKKKKKADKGTEVKKLSQIHLYQAAQTPFTHAE